MKPLRIGVLGAANIARMFIAGAAPSKKIVVAAVASRDKAKAEAFARETGIARALGSYEALLADPEIDAIYNPLPNTLHAEWSIRAVEAGKHVLCEKPLATTAADARAMFSAARKADRHLVEAYPYRAQAQTRKLAELVSSGAIGRLHLVRSSFGVYFDDRSNIRLRPDVGGGALLDAGSYAVSLVQLVAGRRPARVSASAQLFETGVDRTTVATLEFDDGLLAQVSCSFATAYHRHALIAGETGVIECTYLNHPPMGGPPTVEIRRGVKVSDPVEVIEVPGGNGFLGEADSFADLVAGGPKHWTGATPAESVDIAMTLEAILAAIKSGKPQSVDVFAG
ncbi:MAG: gfo/Idh/MocA family oxidoreductase [Alphaproteobacteria bacterium]|nr:gfo/Idh/MocA family oxidoreductase [Alphaproteobacteria bacterium]